MPELLGLPSRSGGPDGHLRDCELQKAVKAPAGADVWAEHLSRELDQVAVVATMKVPIRLVEGPRVP